MLIKGSVNFNNELQEWDGFGVNYVEVCQTYDNEKNPQDYGGFSTLSENKKDEIIDLIFGENGLKPSILKMFLDPLHQKEEPSKIASKPNDLLSENLYDHTSSTSNMLEFVMKGNTISRYGNRSLEIYTTLYGPPKWMTKQKVWRGRDLDEKYSYELCLYIASWVKFLKEKGLPICYAGLHNEGEDFYRWDDNGYTRNTERGHDYNLYWSPEMVSKFLPMLKKVFHANNLDDVLPTPGETTNWTRFSTWGYSGAILQNYDALTSMGLITSHGFFNGNIGFQYFGDHRSAGIDELREKRPDLHAWSTSTSWSNMDARFLLELKDQIYSAKVNGIIPWACIQNHSLWRDGDPNPGCAILIDGKGDYEITKGYWYYKQISTIGSSKSNVVKATIASSTIGIVAFKDKQSKSICIINSDDASHPIAIEILNCSFPIKKATRTSPVENSRDIDDLLIENSEDKKILKYDVPANSATTIVFKEK
mgnify:CR=1 FL=1